MNAKRHRELDRIHDLYKIVIKLTLKNATKFAFASWIFTIAIRPCKATTIFRQRTKWLDELSAWRRASATRADPTPRYSIVKFDLKKWLQLQQIFIFH